MTKSLAERVKEKSGKILAITKQIIVPQESTVTTQSHTKSFDKSWDKGWGNYGKP